MHAKHFCRYSINYVECIENRYRVKSAQNGEMSSRKYEINVNLSAKKPELIKPEILVLFARR